MKFSNREITNKGYKSTNHKYPNLIRETLFTPLKVLKITLSRKSTKMNYKPQFFSTKITKGMYCFKQKKRW